MSNFNRFQTIFLLYLGLVVYCKAQESHPSPAEEGTLPAEQAAHTASETHHAGNDEHKKHWTYNDQTGWVTEYPICKGKAMRQSPIDIITSQVASKDDLSIEFINYDQEIQVKTKNNEHSVCIKPDLASLTMKPEIKLSWLPDGGEFELQEVHFHWGSVHEKGSEHKVNGERAAAEMHMVHFKKGVAAADIGNVENSVAVVGVFIEAEEEPALGEKIVDKVMSWWKEIKRVGGLPESPDSEDTSEHQMNAELEHVLDETSMVNGTDTSKEASDVETENLRNVLPKDAKQFFTYNGSLTTPPCYEVVTWIVLKEPVYIHEEKLEKLYNLATTDTSGFHRINQNFREVQPLLKRPVYSSVNITISPSTDDGSK